MSKINEALVMMANEGETFEVNGKKFQVIEVKDAEQPKEKPHPNALTFEELEDGKSYLLAKADEFMCSGAKFATKGFYYLSNETFSVFASEQSEEELLDHYTGDGSNWVDERFTKYVHKTEQQPDYSHLVGKWLKYVGQEGGFFTKNKWYQVETTNDGQPMFMNDKCIIDGLGRILTEYAFDLSNPSDTNPDEKKKILVPSEVKILNWSSLLGIGFGEGQFLYLLRGSRSYSVAPIEVTINPIQCELVKCERSELKKGDVAFRTSEDEPQLLDLARYCVIIDNERYCFAERNEDVTVGNSNPYHWYKLQPIN